MSKKVLLICRAFPPLNASGAHRPAKLAKYLPAFGWTPVVLCAEWIPENSGTMYDPILAAQPDVCRTVRIPYPATPPTRIGRAPHRVAEILFPYRAPLGFTRRMLAAAEKLVGHERFDVIWSTYMPGLTHHVASRLARHHGIPWVADFRDVPDQYPMTWRWRHEIRQEKRRCCVAAALVATTQPSADHLAARYGAPVYVIHNGFDPADYPPVAEGRLETFTIGYFGTLRTFRDATPLFDALDHLLASGEITSEDLSVRFYGVRAEDVRKRLEGHRCAARVECLPRISHAEMTRVQRTCAILLVMQAAEAGGAIPAKVYDCLGARRLILNVPGDGGPVDELISETGAGGTGSTAGEIARLLRQWYREWQTTGTVTFPGIDAKIARYTRREQAGQLARVLDGIGGGRLPPGESKAS